MVSKMDCISPLIFYGFWWQLGSILLQKSTKIPSKIDPENHQNFDRFLDRFLDHFSSILAPKLEPCWPLVRPKIAQDGPKMHPRRPKIPPKRAQDSPRDPKSRLRRPGPMGYPIFGCFLSFLGRWGTPVLVDFLNILGTMLDNFPRARCGRLP